MSLSVLQWRLSVARARESQRRNQNICPCQRSQVVEVTTASMGMKRITLTRHGALHGVWHHEGCPHSLLRETTQRFRGVPTSGTRARFHGAERKAKLRRLAALPPIPVIILDGAA